MLETSEGCFAPPPPSNPRNDANLSCSFLLYTCTHPYVEQKFIQLMNKLQYEQPGYRSYDGYNNVHQKHRYYECYF